MGEALSPGRRERRRGELKRKRSNTGCSEESISTQRAPDPKGAISPDACRLLVDRVRNLKYHCETRASSCFGKGLKYSRPLVTLVGKQAA
ncbi:hypothetical protein K438DRAFT_1861222 [Mycena galopus ATCC 62051]|nr:hypothetical protein K438DRAFT_1861222 [Mycena galopus ATCC 62051]